MRVCLFQAIQCWAMSACAESILSGFDVPNDPYNVQFSTRYDLLLYPNEILFYLGQKTHPNPTILVSALGPRELQNLPQKDRKVHPRHKDGLCWPQEEEGQIRPNRLPQRVLHINLL